MRTSISSWLVIALASLALPALAANGIRDNAGLFSSSALLEANSTVAAIKQAFGEDLLIETFPTIPNEQRGGYSEQNRARFFADWAVARARSNQVDGVYVLINKEPSYLQSVVGTETIKRQFTAADRDALAKVMRESFRAGNWDEGLLKGAKFVHDTYNANVGKTGAAAPPAAQRSAKGTGGLGGGLFSGSCFLWLIIGGVILLVIRAITGRRQQQQYGQGGFGQQGPPPPYGQPGYGPGYPGGQAPAGGGFGRGMLGGLLGGLAGGYLWDRMSGRSSGNTAWGSTDHSSAPPESAPDTDYSAGGGGDWGGGGGDVGGGGDSGGGGDF